MRLRQLWLSIAVLAAAFTCAAAASAAVVSPAVQPTGTWKPLAASFRPADLPQVCGANGALCYFPPDLQQVYNFPTGPGAQTGAGQTIVVVTAYGAPFMAEVLSTFNAWMELPDAPFEIYNQKTPVPSAAGSGETFPWQVETALDVEWAHAMAPGARIVLAVASSDDTLDVAQLLKEALPKYRGAIVTQSFGGDETGPASDPTAPRTLRPLYAAALQRGGTILASSGDWGASNATELEARLYPELGITPSAMAVYPASDPLVLAVGGTQGTTPDGLWSPNGGYGGEQVWNEVFLPRKPGASGGAPSTLFAAPSWQRSVTRVRGRAVPDVAYNAAVNGGVFVAIACPPVTPANLIYDPTRCRPTQPYTNAVGGTSAGAPQWAAIIALANELRATKLRSPLGFVSPVLYDLASDRRTYARDFHDILVGNNALDLRAFGAPSVSAFGFAARPGYDLATGLGTPNVANLLADLSTRSSGEVDLGDGGGGEGEQGHGQGNDGNGNNGNGGNGNNGKSGKGKDH